MIRKSPSWVSFFQETDGCFSKRFLDWADGKTLQEFWETYDDPVALTALIVPRLEQATPSTDKFNRPLVAVMCDILRPMLEDAGEAGIDRDAIEAFAAIDKWSFRVDCYPFKKQTTAVDHYGSSHKNLYLHKAIKVMSWVMISDRVTRTIKTKGRVIRKLCGVVGLACCSLYKQFEPNNTDAPLSDEPDNLIARVAIARLHARMLASLRKNIPTLPNPK